LATCRDEITGREKLSVNSSFLASAHQARWRVQSS
jgi:hypothetical protein